VRPRIREGIKRREESWGEILADRWLGAMYELNEDGTRILSLCDDEKTVEDITKTLAQDHEMPADQMRPSVEEFLQFLKEHELIAYGPVNREELVKNRFEEAARRAVVYGGEGLETISGFEHYRERPLNAPLNVSFEVTSKCNLRCQHCYANAGDACEGEMPTERVLRFIDELAEMKIFSIAISGGEPMTRKDIFKIISRCIKNDIGTMLSTNGTLITRQKARKLKDLGLRTAQVSVDSIDPKIHDEFRGVKGAHRRAMRGLRYLLEAGIPNVRVATVASKLNFNEIPSLVDYLDKLGVSHQRILRFLPIGRGKTREDLALANEEIKQLLGVLKKKEEESGKIIIDFSDAFNPPVVDRPTHACTGGVLWCAVNPKGYVVPCTYLNSLEVALELKAETIMNKDFKDIWKNYELFKTLRDPRLFLKGKCGNCEYKSTCGGGCRASAYAYTKEILAPDPHCRYEPTQ